MRACLLRAGLSKAEGIDTWALGNPKAWLGTAYHEVLEKLSELELAASQSAPDLNSLWEEAVTSQDQKVKEHPLNRRFGAPDTWPGYYLAWASVQLRGRKLLAERAMSPDPARREGTRRLVLAEREFVAMDGKLVGRPDLLSGTEIIDYKTGEIFEEDLNRHGTVKSAYVRQLHLYGYLVGEALGRRPRRGVLLPMVGDPIEVHLDPAACEREALEAVALLDRYNQMISSNVRIADTASPSPQACKWCPYKLVCPAFWASANENWAGQLDGEAIVGTLRDSPKLIRGGRGIGLSIAVEAGTVERKILDLFPISMEVHRAAPTLARGDRIRISGLGRRQDGSVFPLKKTLLFVEQELPLIQIAQLPKKDDRSQHSEMHPC